MYTYAASRAHIFISHAWGYNSDYDTIISWIKNSNLDYRNYSVPFHDPLDANNTHKLRNELTEQIRPSNIVIVIGGMYAAYSEWIQYEINEAVRMKKKIILIRPRGQERVPLSAQYAATKVVNWNSNSLITAIRELL